MAKGFGEGHDTLQYSEAPISQEDFQLAFERLLEGKLSSELFDWKDGDTRTRRYMYYYHTEESHMEEYAIHGRADDLSQMVPTGLVYNNPSLF